MLLLVRWALSFVRTTITPIGDFHIKAASMLAAFSIVKRGECGLINPHFGIAPGVRYTAE